MFYAAILAVFILSTLLLVVPLAALSKTGTYNVLVYAAICSVCITFLLVYKNII